MGEVLAGHASLLPLQEGDVEERDAEMRRHLHALVDGLSDIGEVRLERRYIELPRFSPFVAAETVSDGLVLTIKASQLVVTIPDAAAAGDDVPADHVTRQEADGFAAAFWRAEDTIKAQRQCITRLRDGWRTVVCRNGACDGWCWSKDGRHEPMTPEEQAVMSR